VKVFQRDQSIHEDAYCHIDEKRIILRDYLAIDRTILSNQNTFLAYIRTALTLFVAGLTFIKFFDQAIIETVGWVFIPLGVTTFIIGTIRYNRIRKVLSRIGRVHGDKR